MKLDKAEFRRTHGAKIADHPRVKYALARLAEEEAQLAERHADSMQVLKERRKAREKDAAPAAELATLDASLAQLAQVDPLLDEGDLHPRLAARRRHLEHLARSLAPASNATAAAAAVDLPHPYGPKSPPT